MIEFTCVDSPHSLYYNNMSVSITVLYIIVSYIVEVEGIRTVRIKKIFFLNVNETVVVILWVKCKIIL